jgi:hypothetical protein
MFAVNDCQPNCAAGHITWEPTSFSVSYVGPCKGKRSYRADLDPRAEHPRLRPQRLLDRHTGLADGGRSLGRVIEVAALVAAAAPVVVRVSTPLSTWEKVAATLTAVGGVGAAVSAFFSWRSARASGRAAYDARDALASSVKPQVHLDFQQYGGPGAPYGGPGSPVEARAVVIAPLSPGGLVGAVPATDVRLEFNLASGGHGSTTLAVLGPGGGTWARELPYIGVVVGHPTDDWPPDGGDRVTATVTYSDVRGAGTYRLSRSCELWPSADRGVVSFRDLSEPTETRIRP